MGGESTMAGNLLFTFCTRLERIKNREIAITILTWIVLGLVAGWIASPLMGSGGYGLIGDVVVGMLGAVVGGWLGSMLLGIDVTGFKIDVTGFNFTSVALSVVGAIVVIVLFRALSPGRRGI